MLVRKCSTVGDVAIAYLGSEVEPQIAVVLYTVLDEQGNFAGQAKLDRVGQATGLAEVCEVLQGEGKRDRLGQVDLDVLAGLVYAAVLPELNGAGSDITLAGELDALFCALN
jgi:hypothetical protein